MDYKDLQEQAKELGLKYVGVSKDDLEENIKEATKEEVEKSPKQESMQENADAVVYDGKREVRTYTFENHGEEYVELAEQYISHPEREGFRIEFETVETRLSCPHCGKKFRYN